jgi:ribosomal protection tetracycline resistance protein
MQTVNIGILAHVDAGKTSLTERLLFDAGAIDALGSVDAGTTQTDTGAIERRRGITIRSAVTAFAAGHRQVNVIDTPGHSDFVAEVERALAVLDGAVLVLSAVEGVQPHTRLLMRLLRELRLPTLLFVNKIDRVGARGDDLVADIRQTLTPYAVPLGTVRAAGTAAADFVPYDRPDPDVLAEHDEALLADLVDGAAPTRRRVWTVLERQTAAAQAYPLYFGCALTGAGVRALRDGVARLLPPAPPPEPELRGRVFAIDRAGTGDKVAYVRSYGGTLRARDTVTIHRRQPDGRVWTHRGQVSDLRPIGAVTRAGPATPELTAGGIAAIRGLREVRIGDQVGTAAGLAEAAYVARPTLETVVRPRRPRDGAAVHRALLDLADQDPLIGTRVGADGRSSLLLYGEVQREVIAATLAEAYGLDTEFLPSQLVHVERPRGVGTAAEAIGRTFYAGVGVRVEPAGVGAGNSYRLEVELGGMPLPFHRAVEQTVAHALEQGPHGWPVVDTVVTLTYAAWWIVVSTAGEYRKLTPLVLAEALAAVGTGVYEPCHEFELEIPPDRLGPVTATLARLGARIGATTPGPSWHLTGELPARTAPAFTAALPHLTGGLGTWSTRPRGDRLLTGTPPCRPRTDGNPYNRTEYLRHLSI